MKLNEQNLSTSQFPTWCAGCGNFGIWGALKKAITALEWPWERVVIVYGIGCSGNSASFLKVYGFHGLHGRGIPVAEGIRLSNEKLKVIVVGGDGDLLGEGLNHFIQACRVNHDITVILHNNQVYGLTTGQSSPTSLKGTKSKTSPMGVPDEPLNPLQLALATGATQALRGFSGDIVHLSETIKKGLDHKGLSIVEVLQPCVTFNKLNTYQWFRERIKKLEKPEDTRLKAITRAVWTQDSIYIGEFFKEEREVFGQNYEVLRNKTLLQLQREKDLEGLFAGHR